MPGIDALQLLLQAGLSFCFCLLLWFAGSICMGVVGWGDDGKKNDYTAIFYRMLFGLLGIVLVYSVYKTSFKTIYLLIVPAAVFYLGLKKPVMRWSSFVTKIPWNRVAEIFLLCGVFCLIYNFLPESEYKQKDSFFYLKIAESLNSTGQENVHQYYNLLDVRYHGVEAYHYIELWLNAFQLNFTGRLLPGIQAFRVITYTPLSVAFIIGLFHFYSVVSGSVPGIAGKLVCFSFVFFMPDLYPFFPAIVNKYLVFNFENNFLERPNFRIIYLFLLPVLSGVVQKKIDRPFLFFLFCLCLVNPLVFLVLLPVFFLSVLFFIGKRYFWEGVLVSKRDVVIFLMISALYPLFYALFSGRQVPAPFQLDWHTLVLFYKRSYRYVLLTTTTTLVYIGVLCLAGWYIFKSLGAKKGTGFLREKKLFVMLAATTVVCSVVLSRAFDCIENFYQVAYLAYMIAALFLFTLLVMLSRRGALSAALVVLLLTGGYIVSKYQNRQTAFANIFLQNGPSCYSGKPYSSAYLDHVIGFMKTAGHLKGAYIADSGYYRDLYYSLHNPVVYHLPLTYIITNNVSSNIDFCASDTSAIYCGTSGQARNAYLASGIARSYFHNGFMTGSNMPALGYLIVTKEAIIDTSLFKGISASFTDENTGERFYTLKSPGP